MNALCKSVVVTLWTWALVFSTMAAPSFGTNTENVYLVDDYVVNIGISAATVGTSITVNWTAPDGHAANDYLRLARTGSQESEYYWTQNLGAATSGSFDVQVPNEVDRFEFRLFRGTDNVRITQSTSFTGNKPGFSITESPLQIPAGAQITVNWESPSGRPSNDQIVLRAMNNGANLDQRYTAATDPKTFIFDAPPDPGDYEFRYLDTTAGQYFAISQVVSVVPADGWFAGRVQNVDTGQFINGALVEVLQQGLVKATGVTNANGGYNIPVSTSGTYDLRVTTAGFPTMLHSGIVLSSGNTAEINFELTSKGLVSGSTVRAGSSVPVVGTTLRLKQSSTLRATATSNAAGAFVFSGIDAGTYSIEAEASGYDLLTQGNINVVAGVTLNVNLSLTPNQSSGQNNLDFVYDDSGRLIGVKENGILTRFYNYDSTGNLLSITSVQTGVPVIFGFSPHIGLAGSQVVINGANFGAQTGQNTVKFNGISAVASFESSSQLIATVPSSATTGPISVISPGGTAVSNSSFVIGSSQVGQPPTVSGFSPAVGHPGDLITITGANFESAASDNDVRFGSTGSPVNSGNTTSLLVPASTSSGKVSVTTPYGSGVSADEFISIPASIDLTKVDPRGHTWFGNTKHVFVAGDRRAAYVFEGYAGGRISLVLPYLNHNLRIEIYRPDGKLLTSHDNITQNDKSTWFIDATGTPLTGTYTIIATPIGPNPVATSFATILYDVPPDITGEMPINSFKTVSFSTPGQNGNLTFHAEAGQRILIKVSDHTFGGVINVLQKFLNGSGGPGGLINGHPITSASFSPLIGTYTPDGVSIPVTGDYNIALDPSGPSVGGMTVELYIVPGDAEYTMNIGSSESIETTARGQNAWINFDGTAGQRISLKIRNSTYPSGFGLSLNKPDGSYLYVFPGQATNNTFVDTLVLPVTGRYKIFVNPPGFDIGAATIDLFDVPADLVATTTVNGSPVTVTATVPGQNPSVSFAGLLGQQVSVNVSAATVPNGSLVSIKKPDGSVLTAAANISSGTALVSSTRLPVAGTYIVEINPPGDTLGTATVAVGGDAFGTVVPGGTSGNATVSNPGQSAWLTFSGTAGQRISAKLTNVTIASGVVSIRSPDGSLIGTAISIGSNNNFIDTVTLPSTGQYSVLIDPNGDSTGSATVNVYNVPADAAGSITSGSSLTKTTTVPGQNLALAFTGSANQLVSVQLSNVSISSGTVGILRSDGSYLSYTNFDTTNGNLTNIALPLSGTYTIYVDPFLDSVGSITIQLIGAGTGTSNPRVQLSQSVAVSKGVPDGTKTVASNSISVLKGISQTSSTSSIVSASISVRFGNLQSESNSASVAVTTGPNIVSLSPLQITGGSTTVLTVSGNNLGSVNAIRFLKSDGSIDSTITVTNISVNPAGTILTASIQSTGSTSLGDRIVVLNTPDLGATQLGNISINLISIVQ